MIRKKLVVFLVFFGLFLSLMTCDDRQYSFTLGGFSYKIPSDYLVIPPPYLDGRSLDSDIGMVALSFNRDEVFREYLGANSWLPKSSILAILYSREGTKLTGFSPSFSQLVDFSVEGKQVVEFDTLYRVFKGDERTGWQTIPKFEASVVNGEIKAKWMADCFPMGGMKGRKKSRESIDIPTSCSINIEYKNVILNLKTSEKNLVNHVDEILRLVINKIDSWIVRP
ncbi:hypothetical protein KDD30_05680 [Photobacterium sp. GJ3]|uniref:hypothetical protein n=1 Tax=Photobacterium sp. GJ3 TaxID=2829502 RepID=UPI001B8BB5F3|nr:hypothetical protein [Photobacterium sp. GJ3]QUJ68602.1 hypothetical protein KDD30_05680 [Photobacterium sp. GJ3]